MLLLKHLQSLSFLVGFFSHKKKLNLYTTSLCFLRDGQTYVKCFACGTFKPRARRAHDFLLQSGFSQEATEAAFNSKGGIS